MWRGTPEIRRSIQSIAEAVETDRQGSNVSRIAVRINEVLIHLLDLFQRKPMRLDRYLSTSRRTVQLFLADLRSHPEHLEIKWSLEDMAKSCGLGTTQFVAHVKSLTNMTPAHYLKRCRLDLSAKSLRERPDASITDIALTSGFSSSQYFATAFAERFGCSPHGYRTRSRDVSTGDPV